MFIISIKTGEVSEIFTQYSQLKNIRKLTSQYDKCLNCRIN